MRAFRLLFPLCALISCPLSAKDIPVEKMQKIEQSLLDAAEEPGAILFTPPSGWKLADPDALPPTIQAMVVGKGKYHFPPSMNLGADPFDGTLKQYLKKVKEINQAHGTEWQDLGKIRTEAGNASLSQVDVMTEWGEVRLMHAILVRDGYAYILTASALKEEFPSFYKDFFASLRSLRFNPDLLESIPSPERQKKLSEECEALQKEWVQFLQKQPPEERRKLFASQEFQDKIWSQFQEKISREYQDLGDSWLSLFLKKMERDLIGKSQ